MDGMGADDSDEADEDMDAEGDMAVAAADVALVPPVADAIDDAEDDADAGMDDIDADEASEEQADVEEDDDDNAVGDLGELLREKSFVITFGFDFCGCCCSGCDAAVELPATAYRVILDPLSAESALKLYDDCSGTSFIVLFGGGLI